MASALPSFAAAVCSGALAAGMLLRQRASFAAWCFLAGMLFLAAEAGAHGLALQDVPLEQVRFWETLALLTAAAHSVCWLTFSLVFSRGNYRQFLRKWRWLLGASAILPVALAVLPGSWLGTVSLQGESTSLWFFHLGPAGKVLNGLLLIQAILILTNLETTFRSAVGTMQWKIKFVVLAVGIIFGSRVYTRSQALLFSGYDGALPQVNAYAVILGCVLIVLAYLRSGLAEIDVYPSQAVLNSSITIFLAGAYLFVVGVLAQFVARLGGVASFQFQVLLVLAAMALLGVLLLSDRLRQAIRLFVSRHFQRPRYDSREVWKRVTQRTSSLVESSALCQEVARVTSETFQALSVTVWTVDRSSEFLRQAGSTNSAPPSAAELPRASEAMRAACVRHGGPFDLEQLPDGWAVALRAVSTPQFPHGGSRLCVPLLTGDRWLGVLVLADRVNGMPYGGEELDLLRCIGDQVAGSLLNLQLTEELMQARELEAFQTMSTFLVHDLKNTASTLSLMLKNLPIHFDNPEFREDAIRGIANTVNRVNDLVLRLGAVREKLELRPSRWDFNELIMEALGELSAEAGLEIRKNLRPLPTVLADREQIRSVATNLLLNSRDALGPGGQITVETEQTDDSLVLSVTDNGCGMSREFIQNSLFRPFQTTKKKGLGIGMFQSRMIVEAHRGRIQVQSEPGAGTTFRVSLPLNVKMERGEVSP